MRNTVTKLISASAFLLIMITMVGCGDKCEDTCINGDCVATTATQKECVCNDGYFGDQCEWAANMFMDTTVTFQHCGNTGTYTLTPRTAPLTFSVSGLGANDIVVAIEKIDNISGVEWPYDLADLRIDKQLLSATEQIEGTGYFNRDDFLQLDYDILDNQDNVIKSCQFFMNY